MELSLLPIRRKMNQYELEEYRKALRKHTKKVCRSKRSARKYLRQLGIIDKSGNLTPEYGGE